MSDVVEIVGDVTPRARDHRRVVTALALGLAAVAGVSYSVRSSAPADLHAAALTYTTPGKPTVHAYVDAL